MAFFVSARLFVFVTSCFLCVFIPTDPGSSKVVKKQNNGRSVAKLNITDGN